MYKAQGDCSCELALGLHALRFLYQDPFLSNQLVVSKKGKCIINYCK